MARTMVRVINRVVGKAQRCRAAALIKKAQPKEGSKVAQQHPPRKKL